MFPQNIHSKRIACVYLISSLTLYHYVHGAITLNERSTNPANKDYNILIGELRLNFASGLNFTWDSNYDRESSGETASFAVNPSLITELYWPISPRLELSTGINVGYDYYLEGPGEDGFTVSGTEGAVSYFDFDVYLSDDASLTFSNTFSATLDSASIQKEDERDEEPYRRFENASSVIYVHRVTPYTLLNNSYTFSNVFSESEDITNDTEYQLHTITSNISSQVNDSMVVSLLAHYFSYLYTESFRNDRNRYRIGPKLVYASESGLTTQAHMAFDYTDVDNSKSPTTLDNDTTALYFVGSLSYNTGSYLTHTFSISHENDASDATTTDQFNADGTIPVNFEEVTSLRYNLNYLINSSLNLGLSYGLSRTDESDGGDKFYQQQIGIEPRYNFAEKLGTYFRYAYTNKFKSEFANANYDRHVVQFGFRYYF